MRMPNDLQSLINDLYAYRTSCPTTMYHPEICTDAAKVIEAILQELEEERYRHDRVQDWTVERDRERENMEKKIHALTVERNTLEKRVEYVQKERLALYRRLMEVEEKLWAQEEELSTGGETNPFRIGDPVWFVLWQDERKVGERWTADGPLVVVALAAKMIGVSDNDDPNSPSFFWVRLDDPDEEIYRTHSEASARAEALNRRDLQTLDEAKKMKEVDQNADV